MSFTRGRNDHLYGGVRGLSMWPTFIPGDILRAREVPARSVLPGQILVLEGRGPEMPVVHRLVQVTVNSPDSMTLLAAGDRGGDDLPREIPSEATVPVVTGVLRRGFWKKPARRPPGLISRLPYSLVRLHCALVRRLCW